MNTTPADRDFAAEMRAVIDAETSHGPYVSRLAAKDVVEKLRANDPDLLTGWLDEQAESLVWQAINDRDRSARAGAKERASRGAFGRATADGDAGALAGFLAVPYVVEDGSRKRLADLTRADLTFVATGYEAQSRQAAMSAAFARALAKKVRTGTVADHFTEEKVAELWRSIGGVE